MVKISVITINYNNAKGLIKTLDSVKTQTYTNFEYIIIDGGSKDESVDIIKDFAANYQNKLIWVSEPDNGLYHAMNKGIARATGEYVLFLNSADYLYDDNTLQFVSQYLNDDIGVVYGDRTDYDDSGLLAEYRVDDKLSGAFLFNSSISQQAAYIKRKLFEEIEFFDEKLKYASDWKFWLQAFICNKVSYLHIDKMLVYFERTGISSLESNRNEMIEERHKVFKDVLPLLYDDYILMNENALKLKRIDRKAIKWGKVVLWPLRKIKVLLKNK